MYQDEQILSSQQYELIARAYNEISKNEKFQFLFSNPPPAQEIEEIFSLFAIQKVLLLNLGGFLGTGKFYSLHCRQLKKIEIIFEKELSFFPQNKQHDKTKLFLLFLSKEFELIQKLLSICDKTLFEGELRKIINDRTSLLSQIFAL